MLIALLVCAALAAPVQVPVSAPVREKLVRTAAQRKIDSQLLYALYRERGDGEKKGIPGGDLIVKFDDQRRALVGIRARVSKSLLDTVKALGGEVLSSSERYNDIQAYLPIHTLETLGPGRTSARSCRGTSQPLIASSKPR
jgi:hypothetical protein